LYQSISCFYKQEQHLKIGLDSLSIGIELFPSDPIFFYDFAHCYSLMKKWEEAKEYYTKLLQIDPQVLFSFFFFLFRFPFLSFRPFFSFSFSQNHYYYLGY